MAILRMDAKLGSPGKNDIFAAGFLGIGYWKFSHYNGL
jgi:hypothetical protein